MNVSPIQQDHVCSRRLLRRLNLVTPTGITMMRIVTTMMPMSRITTVSQGCFTGGTKREHTSPLPLWDGPRHVVPGHLAGLTLITKPSTRHCEAYSRASPSSLLFISLAKRTSASTGDKVPNRGLVESPGVARVQHLREHSRNTAPPKSERGHSPLSRAFLSFLNLYALSPSVSKSWFINRQTPL
jgi:hypothetical protein